MAQSDEDLQPKPLNEGGGMGRFCAYAKSPKGNGPPGEKHLLPDVTARGRPPARGQPILLICLAMSAFRRRISCQETCPSGAGLAKLYPNEKAD